MREQGKVSRWIRILKAHGAYAIKVVVSSKAGDHDIVCCIEGPEGLGRFCTAEGKQPNRSMAALQIAKRNDCIKAGGLSIECKYDEDIHRLIQMAKSGRIQVVEEEEGQLDNIEL